MKRNGFTLIELVVVIAIMGIVAAIVLPKLDPLVPSRQLKSAARTLSGTITLAYGEAVAKNKQYRLYLDPAEGQYWVVRIEKPEGADDSRGAIGIKLGTHMELLQYQETNPNVQETAPSEPLFALQTLPAGVHFFSISTRDGVAQASTGSQFIDFSPLGAASPVTIKLINEDGKVLSLRYDGITGVPSISSISET